jgi:MoaA/NifB/PqqE/SkfB family radical SAM enzyme
LKTVDFWKEIASTGNKRLEIIFSIDGLEDTNMIYRRNTNWGKIIENVKAFIGKGGIAIWEYLAFKHNEHQITQAKLLSVELGFQEFRLKKAFGFETDGQQKVIDENGYYEYTILPPENPSITNISAKKANNIDKADVLKKTAGPSQLSKLYDETCDLQVPKYNYRDYTEISCLAKNGKELYIDAGGEVHPCCFLGHVSQESPGYNNDQYMYFSKNFNTKISIEEALSDKSYFNQIEESWSKNHTGNRIKTCSQMCSVKRNQLDDLYANDNKPNKKHKF